MGFGHSQPCTHAARLEITSVPSDLGEETSDDTVLYCTDPLRGQKIGFCYSDPCTPIGIMGIRSASSDRELAKEHSFRGAAVLSMHSEP